MATRTRTTGPVADFELGAFRLPGTGENPQLGYKIEGDGFVAYLVKLNAAAGAVHGAFCFVDPEDTSNSWEAVPATNTNAAALNAASRPNALCGFIQADTTIVSPNSAADNEVGWLVVESLDPNGGLFAIHDGSAVIAQFGQVTTTAVAGTINDAAGVGTFNISNVTIVTATPGTGPIATGVTWSFPRLAAAAN